MRTVYDTIHLTTGIHVPPLYRQMVADGVTHPVTSAEDAERRALSNPPALMMAQAQVEWWLPEDMVNWDAPDHFDPAHRLLPFASTATGDLWCWYQKNGEESIVLAPHDENGATYFAPDLEAFLLRHLLQAFAEILDDDGLDFTPAQRSEVARANVKTLAPYLNEGWLELLTELAARPLVRDEEWDCLGLLGRDEAIMLIQTELDMPTLGETFAHFRLAR